MKRGLIVSALLIASIAIGVLAGEIFYRTEFSGRICTSVSQRTGLLDRSTAQELVRQETLRKLSQGESVLNEELERSLNLLRYQFPDEAAFLNARNSSGLTFEALRAEVTDHLRALRWIERQIAPDLRVDPAAIQRFYDEKQPRFAQPQRYRVSHIFRAAPDGYPEEVIAVKRSDIQGLAVRILAGEKFDDLVNEASEDEESKKHGGDLGYFSVRRMPSEFMAELEKMHVDEISAPIRSHLGFHIVRLTELKAARQMSFEEVEGEIALLLANERRTAALAHLTERLAAQ